uniref:Uncharacterized protein n=1 Tax=Anguilla anguilla TaxID=7936 RepID=A0A0E9PUD7_ANGAN
MDRLEVWRVGFKLLMMARQERIRGAAR